MHREASYQTLELLNRWWSMDLMWDDLGVGESGDLQDLNRLGRVGVMGANWDMPFRPADRYNLDLRENVGPDAGFIAFNPFPADNGRPQIFLANEAMRPIFFPVSNTEVLASFLYLDFMSRVDTLQTLQLGVEGIHWYYDAAGAFVFIPNQDADGNYNWEDRYVMPSGRNFDITITANGIGEDLLFYSYPGSTPAEVAAARDVATRYGRTWPAVSVRGRAAEEGMAVLRGGAAETISRQIAVRLVQGNPATFSERFASEWEDYMNMGGRAIIEERLEAWNESIGDCDFQADCQ
jgi:putative aldouronate transport system substrate-binding protein